VSFLSTLFFHVDLAFNRFGLLPASYYLGIVVFFALSGYLIGKMPINSINYRKFSLLEFYEKSDEINLSF
jgi:peptidoglycan/LPS O-acetylase OafA/YrhL